MRPLRWALLAIAALALVAFAVGNRQPVTVRLLPEGMGGFAANLPAVTVPAFMLIFGGMLLGLLVGFLWEWVREHRHRAEAARRRREVAKLESENDGLKRKQSEDDELAALLE